MVIRMSAPLLLAGCVAASAPAPDRDAVADFVEVRQLEQVDQIRKSVNDGWSRVNDYYVVYETRRGSYLMQFSRRCSELEDTEVVADKRWEANKIRARFDTLRGCRIERIYALAEADALELESIGKSPQDGS
jgi:hypothetical protein